MSRMALGSCFKYWDDCVDPEDMEAMWLNVDVNAEWLNVGEVQGEKVHLSRDLDGHIYLTPTEMRAVVNIVAQRNFDGDIDEDMIYAIAELQSSRRILAMQTYKKSKEITHGIMQVSPKTAVFLARECGYMSYEIQENPNLLYRPFVSVYFGAAYLKWLWNFQDRPRSEEFVVRAYVGGTKKALHKSTLPFWQRYLSIKESIPPRTSVVGASASQNRGSDYWNSRVSPGDMEAMWNHPDVVKEWVKSGERRAKMRFSHDEKNRPYLSRVELRAVAEVIIFKFFSSRNVKPAFLCALAEMVSMRFVDGNGSRPGIMGIDYSIAFQMYMELGYRDYKIESPEDLTNPFVSMYFGAAYLAWLYEYEGRERSPQFVVEAYLFGPQNVNHQDNITDPSWLEFEQTLSQYSDGQRHHCASLRSCTIL